MLFRLLTLALLLGSMPLQAARSSPCSASAMPTPW